eukprot:6184346-Pleurochrysis_carterae.AAC.3
MSGQKQNSNLIKDERGSDSQTYTNRKAQSGVITMMSGRTPNDRDGRAPQAAESSEELRIIVDVLTPLIAETAPCQLQPRGFFVAWNGVLTMAFSGFPPQLALLKQQINTCSVPLLPEQL